MLNCVGVSCILLFVWVISFLFNKKWIYTAKIYYLLLLLMAIPGTILDLDSMLLYFTPSYSFGNILLFAILMLLVLNPWKQYDLWMQNCIIEVNGKYIKSIKLIVILLVMLSVFSLIYCMPYAIQAMVTGALEIRTADSSGFLPPTIATTIATALAGLAPFGLLGFFVCRLDKRISSYSYLSLLIPIASIVHSMAFAARELYIYLPITFIILYMFFRNSLSSKDSRNIIRFSVILLLVMVFIILILSISRFGTFGSNQFIRGTWGYLYQQPYVFDQTLRFFDNFYEFDRRLPFLGEIFNIGDGKFELYDSVEWSFGTMYNEFYEMFGHLSLFIGALLYWYVFNLLCKISIVKKSAFAVSINLTIFIWFTISGMFYFRYGDTSYFLLYMFIAIASIRCPQILKFHKTNK